MTDSSADINMSRTAEEARAAAHGLRDEAASRLAQARDAAVTGAAAGAETAKDRAADEVSAIATALRRASDELRDGSPQERTFGQIAETLADMSDGVRDKDMRDIVQDVSGFARRNPLAFLGGAALLGFAATRFAKAGQDADADTPRTAGDGGYHPEPHEAAELGLPPRSAAPASAFPTPAVNTSVPEDR